MDLTPQQKEPTRAEHLDFCKRRALAYLDHGAPMEEVFASMASDMQKHPETQNHSACGLGLQLLMNGHLSTKGEMRSYIQGFN